jgi:hypothetical protein
MKLKQQELYQLTVDELNKRNILPFSARNWSWENVRQIDYFNQKNKANGNLKRPDVMAILKEITIKKLDEIRDLN